MMLEPQLTSRFCKTMSTTAVFFQMTENEYYKELIGVTIGFFQEIVFGSRSNSP